MSIKLTDLELTRDLLTRLEAAEKRIKIIEERLRIAPKEEATVDYLRRQRKRRENMREASWGKEEL